MIPFNSTYEAAAYFGKLTATGIETGPICYKLTSGKWWMYVRFSQWN